MTVAQGFVTGLDTVFIRSREPVPRGEENIYLEYLPDRQITRYSVPRRTAEVGFYPFDHERPLTEGEIESDFPKTWAYLCSNREQLETRKAVVKDGIPWWRPERPREPTTILRPKIVCPHLMLTPRFAINPSGRLAVSRSPFIFAKDEGEGQTLIRFFCAVLNSTVCSWYLRTYAPKYGSGYNRLEVNLLSAAPVPNLVRVNAATLASVIDMVGRLSRRPDPELDNCLDDLICSLYGFTPTERRELFGLR
jgi:hypothetical protein